MLPEMHHFQFALIKLPCYDNKILMQTWKWYNILCCWYNKAVFTVMDYHIRPFRVTPHLISSTTFYIELPSFHPNPSRKVGLWLPEWGLTPTGRVCSSCSHHYLLFWLYRFFGTFSMLLKSTFFCIGDSCETFCCNYLRSNSIMTTKCPRSQHGEAVCLVLHGVPTLKFESSRATQKKE